MNWLAHVYLSEPDTEARLGNLLADLVKGKDRAGMSPAFQRGVQQHQVIDAFTDSHPIVHQSRARIGEEHRRVAGILVDVFYDYFLATGWDRYSAEPLGVFTTRLYADIRALPIHLPEEAQAALDRMISEDRLGSYARIDGIEAALRRVAFRLEARIGKTLGIERAVGELTASLGGLGADFAAFFPLLQEHVRENAGIEPGAAKGSPRDV